MLQKGMPAMELLSAAHRDGVAAVIDVGIAPDDLPERQARLSALPWVHLTSGLHPSQATRGGVTSLLATLEAQLERREIIAVGEIGLDYHWDTGERRVQHDLFDGQLSLAATADLPVIVHNREADRDVLAFLARPRPTGVMHCFSQNAAFCRSCLDLGLHISFGGNLTYRNSEDVREAARLVPAGRLLVETDAPYLSPQAVRGRHNHPGHLGFTIEALAGLRGEDPAELAVTTAANARALFGI